jgi:hypothetical protein
MDADRVYRHKFQGRALLIHDYPNYRPLQISGMEHVEIKTWAFIQLAKFHHSYGFISYLAHDRSLKAKLNIHKYKQNCNVHMM